MILTHPFPENIKNKTFFYLWKRESSGQYDLFLTIPVGVGQRAKVTKVDDMAVAEHINNITFAKIEMVPDNTRVSDTFDHFVFWNIQPSPYDPENPENPKLIEIPGNQYIEFEDADLIDDDSSDQIVQIAQKTQIALGCPYLFFQGMTQGPPNFPAPKVIVPLNGFSLITPHSSETPQDTSNNGNLDMRSIVTYTSQWSSQGFHWEVVENIGSYPVPEGNLNGGFEVIVALVGASGGGRKTKVKHRNKTSIGNGGRKSCLRRMWVGIKDWMTNFFR